jgi:DnaK suppressor protein
MRPKPHLTREQLRELERALRSARARLERAMARTRAHRLALRKRDALLPEGGAAGRSRSLTPSPKTLGRHQELVAAIRRLEAGSYGVCRRCGAPIDYERLVRNPTATHCAECAGRARQPVEIRRSRRSVTHSREEEHGRAPEHP